MRLSPFWSGEAHRQYTPPTNYPQFFYGFLSVAMAWQIAFLVIGSIVTPTLQSNGATAVRGPLPVLAGGCLAGADSRTDSGDDHHRAAEVPGSHDAR